MSDSIEDSLIDAVLRVMEAETELQRATAEYEKVFEQVVGRKVIRPDVGKITTESRAIELTRPNANGQVDSPRNLQPLMTELETQPGRKGIRNRVKEYCRQDNTHSLTAEQIAIALGTKLTTTRFELYQLQKQGIVTKLGIDQWKYAARTEVNGAQHGA
jgi:hypothetical protein